MEPDEQQEWDAWVHDSSITNRNRLIERYLPLVRGIAWKFFKRMPRGTGLDVDDIQSFGVLGLIQAIERFDLSRGMKFQTYGQLRIIGRIKDEMRNLDWVPRLERKRGTEATTISNEGGHAGISLRLMSEPERSSDPWLQRMSTADTFKELLAGCSQRERLLILLYYHENRSMKEIGQQLGTSESRISQMHAALLTRLREKHRVALADHIPKPQLEQKLKHEHSVCGTDGATLMEASSIITEIAAPESIDAYIISVSDRIRQWKALQKQAEQQIVLWNEVLDRLTHVAPARPAAAGPKPRRDQPDFRNLEKIIDMEGAPVREKIIACLKLHGRCRTGEIAQSINHTISNVSAILTQNRNRDFCRIKRGVWALIE